MKTNQLKFLIGIGLSACAFGAVPATASAADTSADPGPCLEVGKNTICPLDITQRYVNYVIDTVERTYDNLDETIAEEYDEIQDLYRGVEDDLNAYLCRQTGNPTYCNNTGG